MNPNLELAPEIIVDGVGAVSPAGWGVASLLAALKGPDPLPLSELQRPGWQKPLRVRRVPPDSLRPGFISHGRLRRTSPITHYTVAAALEALGNTATWVSNGALRLGIIFCTMSGCVNYSRRFYDETLRNPATASPLVFPETVFNAPSSHLAAVLGATAINYALVGDPGTFLQGIALAAHWLLDEQVDGCVIIGAEELDWLTADAFLHFDRQISLSEGAGAIYLRRGSDAGSTVQLGAVTDPQLYSRRATRTEALKSVRLQLPQYAERTLLCDSAPNQLDAVECAVWKDWPGRRITPKAMIGDGLMASSAWQCIAAIEALRDGDLDTALVSVAGCNEQAIGASFLRRNRTPSTPNLA